MSSQYRLIADKKAANQNKRDILKNILKAFYSGKTDINHTTLEQIVIEIEKENLTMQSILDNMTDDLGDSYHKD